MTTKHIPVFSTPPAIKLSKDARRAFSGYVPRIPREGEATPSGSDLWSRPTYVPTTSPTRAGSQDALRILSFGLST